MNNGTILQRYTTPMTQDAKVTANTNGAGKLTNGWTMNGIRHGAITRGAEAWSVHRCLPDAWFVPGTTISQDSTDTPLAGLKVNGIDLPNTPVADAPVA